MGVEAHGLDVGLVSKPDETTVVGEVLAVNVERARFCLGPGGPVIRSASHYN